MNLSIIKRLFEQKLLGFRHGLKALAGVFTVKKKDDLDVLERFICSNNRRDVIPPKNISGVKWAMIDSGSEPTVADATKCFPKHQVRPSKGQREGLSYVSATGDQVKNEGEVAIIHRDAAPRPLTDRFRERMRCSQ